MLHMIGALERPDSGVIISNGTEVTALRGAAQADYPRILLASHDPQIAARCERLIRLRDGAVVDDIQLTGNRPAQDIIRHVGQLG
jgi:putative ABC transport system ATP-binding protein